MAFEKNKPSEGEEFIAEYLMSERIRFIKEYNTGKLKGDDKEFRLADFYLRDYKVCLEFFGQWQHGEEHKQRYKFKKDLYERNNIPCIYLYPENLGIIDFIFRKRLIQALKEHNYKRQLLRWRLIESYKETKDYFFPFLLCVLVLVIGITAPKNYFMIAIGGLGAAYYVYMIVSLVVEIFNE